MIAVIRFGPFMFAISLAALVLVALAVEMLSRFLLRNVVRRYSKMPNSREHLLCARKAQRLAAR